MAKRDAFIEYGLKICEMFGIKADDALEVTLRLSPDGSNLTVKSLMNTDGDLVEVLKEYDWKEKEPSDG